MITCDKTWQGAARCSNILRSLGSKFKVVVDVAFLSKMGD